MTDIEFDVQQSKHWLTLYEELLVVRAQMQKDGDYPAFPLDDIHQDFKDSALNLLHYLSLRRVDLRSIQSRLSAAGLSSLGGSESCVLSSIDRVLNILEQLTGEHSKRETSPIDFLKGRLTLEHHSKLLLGGQRPERAVHIMVTMPTEAAQEYTLIQRLLERGMDCMRINCAHDGPEQWLKMIDNLHRAEQKLQCSCRIAMDLAGPKLRTGPIKPGPEVIKVKPKRDTYGRVVEHARIWLSSREHPCAAPSLANADLAVEQKWLTTLKVSDQINLRDIRGAKRVWQVIDVSDTGVWLEANDTAYIANGLLLTLQSDQSCTDVAGVPAKPQGIKLLAGDTLILVGDNVPGTPASRDRAGRVLRPATIGCTLPKCLSQVKQGDSIWFDDGKIGGVIEQVETTQVVVRITKVRAQGRVLRADKGINLPDSHLQIPALSSKDREDLAFVAQHADIVALSFVNKVADVEALKSLLCELGENRPAIVLKIETRQGFVNLPHLLLSLMTWPCSGVMIARGDLAVECGFERMAEVQEEILWLCEAAHIPVIWATQVLESLAKEGLPSRAEISDAAMGHRAECVMLNKGPHIDMAVQALGDILERMQNHQNKKRPMLRRLQVAMFQ